MSTWSSSQHNTFNEQTVYIIWTILHYPDYYLVAFKLSYNPAYVCFLTCVVLFVLIFFI